MVSSSRVQTFNLLMAVAATESSDPRDRSQTASNLLTFCSPSCQDITLITIAAFNVLEAAIKMNHTSASPALRFCTDPQLAILWNYVSKVSSPSQINHSAMYCPCSLKPFSPLRRPANAPISGLQKPHRCPPFPTLRLVP